MDHVEPVPVTDLKKSPNKVFYLSMENTVPTTKIQIVFDASAPNLLVAFRLMTLF